MCFVACVFDADSVTVAAGVGEAPAVVQWSSNDFPESALEVIPELERRFGLLAQPRVLGRAEFDAWLRRLAIQSFVCSALRLDQ